MKKALALDIGGTNLRCALINENYEIEKVIIHDTKHSNNEIFLTQVEEIINEIGITSDIVGISIGVPGKVRWDGYIFSLPNVGIQNIPLAEYINTKFHLTTFVKNDAEMAALAEGIVGAGKSFDSTMFFTISTGIGGALIRNKKLMVPSDEIGHTLVEYEGKLYEFEKLCSGKYIVDLCKMNNLYVENAKEFFLLKSSGNETALKVFNIWLDLITKLFQFVKKYFEVDVIVLSGGMIKSSQYFLEELRAKNSNISIKLATFDQTAGLIGSAYYAFNPQ